MLQERKQEMTEAVVLDFLYKLICRIEMPYPKEVLDLVLLLFQGVVNSFKNMMDNQMKGYFFEFLEKCLLLKKSGGVDGKLLDAVVASVANVQYICCTVCLKGCQPRRKALINPLPPTANGDYRLQGSKKKSGGLRKNTSTALRTDGVLSW